MPSEADEFQAGEARVAEHPAPDATAGESESAETTVTGRRMRGRSDADFRLFAQAQGRVDGGLTGSPGRLPGLTPGRPAPAAWRKAAESVAARAAAESEPAADVTEESAQPKTRTTRARTTKAAKPKADAENEAKPARRTAKSAASAKPATPAKAAAKTTGTAKPTAKAASAAKSATRLSGYQQEAAELLAAATPRRRRRTATPPEAEPQPQPQPATPPATEPTRRRRSAPTTPTDD